MLVFLFVSSQNESTSLEFRTESKTMRENGTEQPAAHAVVTMPTKLYSRCTDLQIN